MNAPLPTLDAATSSSRIFRAVLNYGLGSYIPQIVNFILVPVYTTKISPSDMGILEIALTLQALFAIAMRLGLAGSVTRYFFDFRDSEGLRDFVTTVALLVVASSSTILLIALFAGPTLFQMWWPEIPFHPYMEIALATAFFQAAPDLQRRLMQAREQSGQVARLNAIFGVLATSGNILAVIVLDAGILGILLAGLAVSVIYAAFAIWNNWADIRGTFRREMARDALKYGFPLVPYHVAAWGHQFASRWALGGVGTVAMLGQVGVASRVTTPLSVARDAMGNAFTPIYFSWRKELGDARALVELRRYSRVLLLIGSLLSLGAGTYGAWFLRHFMNDRYRDGAVVVGALAVAQFAHLVYGLVACELFYHKRTAWISIIFIVSTAASIGVVFATAAKWGLLSVGFAQIAGGVVELAIATTMATRTFPAPIAIRPAVMGAAISLAALAAPFAISYQPPAVELGLDTAFFGFGLLAALAMFGRPVETLRAASDLIVSRIRRKRPKA